MPLVLLINAIEGFFGLKKFFFFFLNLATSLRQTLAMAKLLPENVEFLPSLTFRLKVRSIVEKISLFLTEKNNGGTFLKVLFLTCYKPDRRHFIISFRLVLISKTEMTIL